MTKTYIAASRPDKDKRRWRGAVLGVVIAHAAGAGACRPSADRGPAPHTTPAPAARPLTSVAPGETFTVVAAGDVAGVSNEQAATARLLFGALARGRLAAILVLGDVQYPAGDLADFRAHYARSWGLEPLLSITRPVPGNHDYALGLSEADGYFDYFNGTGEAHGRAGDRGKGYYSYDLGDWHFVALNTNDGCRKVSCAPGGDMHRWLVADLAATAKRCVLAYWHHPRFHLGDSHGDEARAAPLWDALYDAGADVVLAGHEHNFQRLAPLDKGGRIDAARGLRSFVVGTGGAGLYHGFRGGPQQAALEAATDQHHGILELTLGPGRYSFRFRAVDGSPDGTVRASGSDVCH